VFGFTPAFRWIFSGLFVAVAPLALAGGGGCSKNPATASVDAGADAVGDPGRDGGPVGCPLQTICDGNTVRVCQLNGAGAVIEVCADGAVCSRGRCASASCAEAEKEASFAGCIFYAAQLDNVDSDDGQPSTIIITNPGTAPVNVTVEARAPGQPWAALAPPMIIQPASAHGYPAGDRHIEGTGRGDARALRLVSDAPVTAMSVQSDDSTLDSSSSAGTLLLPAHALGLSYMAMTYVQRVTPKVAAIAGARNGAGEILIVATQDATQVTITVPATATVSGLPLPAAPAGDGGTAADSGGGRGAHFTVSLDDGDTYQLFSTNEGDDLSGTLIQTEKPIAVFSGNVSTTYGFASDGLNSPDMAAEQLLPISAWSRTYVAAGLQAQTASGCDSPFGDSVRGLWRILASEDGTQITFDSPTAIPELAAPGGWTMNRGEVRDLRVSVAGDFVVTASKPIMMIQGIDCEATLSSAVPAEELMSDLFFALPPNFDHQLAIARPRATAIQFDGTFISGSQFFDAGGAFEVARIHVPPCVGPTESCVHHLSGKFGLTLRGMDVVSSYAVTAPTWLRCFDTGCVN
jgi:hypothetical protein